jgi:hypothetical protein
MRRWGREILYYSHNCHSEAISRSSLSLAYKNSTTFQGFFGLFREEVEIVYLDVAKKKSCTITCLIVSNVGREPKSESPGPLVAHQGFCEPSF